MMAGDLGSGVAIGFFAVGAVFFLVLLVRLARQAALRMEAAARAAAKDQEERLSAEAAAQAARDRHRGPRRQLEDSVAAQAPGASPAGYEALALLTPMQRRFVMADLLGEPAALRAEEESG